jgi:hypothetical protein
MPTARRCSVLSTRCVVPETLAWSKRGKGNITRELIPDGIQLLGGDCQRGLVAI